MVLYTLRKLTNYSLLCSAHIYQSPAKSTKETYEKPIYFTEIMLLE